MPNLIVGVGSLCTPPVNNMGMIEVGLLGKQTMLPGYDVTGHTVTHLLRLVSIRYSSTAGKFTPDLRAEICNIYYTIINPGPGNPDNTDINIFTYL